MPLAAPTIKPNCVTDEELSPGDEAEAPDSSHDGASSDASVTASPSSTDLRARWAERRAARSNAARARAIEASEASLVSAPEAPSTSAALLAGGASKDTVLRARWAERRAMRSGASRVHRVETASMLEPDVEPAPDFALVEEESAPPRSDFKKIVVDAPFDESASPEPLSDHPVFDSRSFQERSVEPEPFDDAQIPELQIEGPSKPRLVAPAPYVPGRLLSRAKPPFWSLEQRPLLRKIIKPAGLFCLASVIVVNAVFITRESLRKPSAIATSSASAQAVETSAPVATGASSDVPAEDASGIALDKGAPNDGDDTDHTASDDHSDPSDDENPKIKGNAPPSKHVKKAQTVGEALSTGCSTSSVDALSRQIVAEARCINADAFAIVPQRPNLVISGNVSLRLEAPARDKLLHVLDAFPHRTMTVNSALRTVAQQYLLDHWARTKRCGIELAARPGESNHESGLALDVKEHGTWRPALEAQGFRWLGPSDRVHFDFKGPGAAQHDGLDVLAFQRLWNRNHPDDAIAENGHYDAPTEAHLRKAPAQGFPSGPACGRRQADRAPAHPHSTAH